MCYSYPLEMSQYYHYTYSEPMSRSVKKTQEKGYTQIATLQ